MLAAAAVAGAWMPWPAHAQDPRASVAQSAARDWLKRVDALDAAGSRSAAGAKFREAMDDEQWRSALTKVRAPLGQLDTRTVEGTRFASSLPGFPPGDYAVVVFRATFAKAAPRRETVTLERDGDTWRVVGYVIA